MFIRLMAFMILFPCIANFSIAADVWFQNGKRDDIDDLVIEGEIEVGDFDKIEKEIFDFGPPIQSVFLYSPGGDAREAMRIGDLLRSLHLTTFSPDFSLEEYRKDRSTLSPACEGSWKPLPKSSSNCTCNSACFLIWLGGLERRGVYVGVHRPVFDANSYSSMSSQQAEAAYQDMIDAIGVYLEKYDVPQDIVEKMLNTPSHEIHGVWAEKLGGFAAFYDERLTAMCGVESSNSGRIELLMSKKNEGRITAKEEKELAAFQPEHESNLQIKKCRTTQYIFKDRLQAFERYFGPGYIEQWIERRRQ